MQSRPICSSVVPWLVLLLVAAQGRGVDSVPDFWYHYLPVQDHTHIPRLRQLRRQISLVKVNDWVFVFNFHALLSLVDEHKTWWKHNLLLFVV